MLQSLNKEQKEAVEHIGSPLLVSAGPGSGKTRVITERVKFLLKNGFKPSEILCLTFTVKAAQEMKQRLDDDGIDTTEIEINNYHSFFHEVLEKNKMSTGFGRGNIVDRASFLVWGMENIDSFGFNSSIEIRNNAAEIIEAMIDGISTFKDELVTPDEINDFVEKKESGALPYASPEEIEYVSQLENLVKVYKRYDAFKIKQDIMDFDDIIVLTYHLLHDKTKKHILTQLKNKYKYILIDEFQDNNFAQFEIVKTLVTDENITVVGDSDQSIYRFQGAYPEIFADFKKTYPNYKEIQLIKNYRNSDSVVKVSSQLLMQSSLHVPKQLVSTKSSKEKVSVVGCANSFDEAEFVKREIQELIKSNKGKVSFRDFAVLSRKQRTGLKVVELLTAAGIPANYVGKSRIFESPSARTVLAFLRTIADPAHSMLYITKLLHDYSISELNISKINKEASYRAKDKDDGDYAFEVISDLKVTRPQLSAITQETQIKEVSDLLKEFIQIAKDKPITTVIYQIVREKTDIFKNTMDDTFENYVERSVLLDFEKNAGDLQDMNPNATIRDFLNFIESLQQFEVETEQGVGYSDSVQVSTIHQSKGKEFAYVFVIDVAPKSMPLSYREKSFYVPKELAHGLVPVMDPEMFFKNEERRVLYVAMTRAIEKLYITFPTTFSTGRGRNPSIFLQNLLNDAGIQQYIDVPPIFSTATQQQTRARAVSAIEIKKNEKLAEITKHLNSGQHKSAIEKIVDLEKIKMFKKKNTTSGFDLKKFLNIKPSNTIDKELKGTAIPTINVSDIRLSKSAFESYQTCPLQFKFARVWNCRPTGKNNTLYRGTAFHDAVAVAADPEPGGLNNVHDLKGLKKILDVQWDKTQFLNSPKSEEALAKKDIKGILGVYQKWTKSNPNKVVGTEVEFKMKIGGKNVIGYIDRIEQTPQGDYHLIDYKTGGKNKKPDPVEDLQLNLYSQACKNGIKDKHGKTLVKAGTLPKKAILFYLEKEPGHQIFEYDVTEGQVKKVMKELEKLVKRIDKKEFDATPGFHCKWCDYRNICEEAV